MAVTSGTIGRVRAEDVLGHVEGGIDEMSGEEVVENAALAERHEELLRAHGYRLVRAPSVLCLLRHCLADVFFLAVGVQQCTYALSMHCPPC